jgi:hypothetical protein
MARNLIQTSVLLVVCFCVQHKGAANITSVQKKSFETIITVPFPYDNL